MSKKSFTLIELLVVIAIIGLLASIVLVWLDSTRAQARDAKRIGEVGTLRTALELRYDDYDEYPAVTDWIEIEEDADNDGPFSQAMENYLPQIPRDPLYPKVENPGEANEKVFAYQYQSTEDQQGYKIHIEMETGEYAFHEVYGGVGGGDIVFEGTSWTCGDSVTFDYKGESVTYGTVSSSGNCWLDRNLGATRVATAYNDSAAYGDLFQWGREDDGHQVRSPSPDTVEGDMSLTEQPGHDDFITEQDSPYDWADNSLDNPLDRWITRWTDGNGDKTDADPCPNGWRVPTSTEWDIERLSWSSNNYYGAYASPLKLTAAGYRHYGSAEFKYVDSNGRYWSSAVSQHNAVIMYFSVDNAMLFGNGRALGYSVRCIKN